MASQLFIGTNGSENLTKATFPFIVADHAQKTGHKTAIILMGDAVVLMRNAVADSVQGIAMPPLKDVMASLIEAKVPIYT